MIVRYLSREGGCNYSCLSLTIAVFLRVNELVNIIGGEFGMSVRVRGVS